MDGLTPSRPRIVVAEATLPDGIGSTFTKRYAYVGAREDILRGTFMGFQERHVRTVAPGSHQDVFPAGFPRTGRVWKTEVFRDGTTLLLIE